MPEPWLRGPLPGVPALLQPVAHALVMSQEDVAAASRDLTVEQWWARPGGVASVGFHVAHLSGSTERLLTYAQGRALSAAQLEALAGEGEIDRVRSPGPELVDRWSELVAATLVELGNTDESTLLDPRAVGRAGLPSTVLGLLFHIAEHASRHTGQLVTTAKLVRASG